LKISNINFKENTKVATQKSIKHGTFDQTNKKGSDFMDRKSLGNTFFFAEIRVRTCFAAKKRLAAATLTEFFCFNGTNTLTQTEIE